SPTLAKEPRLQFSMPIFRCSMHGSRHTAQGPQWASKIGNRVSPREESERDRSSVIGQHDFDRLVFGLKLVFLFLDGMSRSLDQRLGSMVGDLFVGLAEFDADNFAHALFLHRHAE